MTEKHYVARIIVEEVIKGGIPELREIASNARNLTVKEKDELTRLATTRDKYELGNFVVKADSLVELKKKMNNVVEVGL